MLDGDFHDRHNPVTPQLLGDPARHNSVSVLQKGNR
jgi:hypothetical protein